MANTLSALIVTLGLDAGEFQKGIDGAEKSAGSFAARMQKIGGQMQKIGGAMTVGLTLPIAAFGASSVKSAMDAEAAIAALESTIESTGNATGITSKEFQKYASELQKVTGFSDEEIISAQTMLLTFDKIGKDSFPRATEAALDLSQRFGMDLQSASIMLGKALQDPTAGLGALSRIGVSFTEEQKYLIASFMKVNDVAGAQAIIFEAVESQVKGAAKAFGETSAGEFEQFKNQLDDMKEIVGTALIPVLIRLMEAVTPLIEKFSNASPATQNMIISLAAIVAAAGPVITTVGGITSAIGTLTPVITGLFTFITATAIPAIGAFIIANAAWIVPLLLVAATVYLVYLAFKNNFGGITTTVQQLWFIIKWAFGNIVNSIKSLISRLGDLAKKFLTIKLPDFLTPGSPTPFEMGLRGISSAANTLANKGLPSLEAGLNLNAVVSGANGGGAGSTGAVSEKNIVINIQNPKKETSEESVKKTLQNLSYLGVMQ